MPYVHDRGGLPDDTPIDRTEHTFAQWEDHTHALLELLIGPKHHFNLDEFRRAIEGIEREKYETMTYYERWLTAIETCLVQKGVLTREEVDERVRRMGEVANQRIGESANRRINESAKLRVGTQA